MPSSIHTSSPRVLVVEDDAKLATLLCRALGDAGLAADAVLDGETALARLRAGSFAAVVLDVGLPRLSGLHVCAHLRAEGSGVPVVMLSARVSIEDVEAGHRAGATDYLLKPFSVRELVQRLDDLIGGGAAPHRQLIGAA